ncbi:MAG TPA: GNAT family N-acetyltransferase [Trebonia sp.]|nr:GNAT family N-acetyltransferase [Trebonia sp.]
MAPSLDNAGGAGLERSCDPDEWVQASRPADGVELFRARLRGRPFSRHRHDVYAIGITEEGVQAFDYRGTVEHCLPGQVYVLHPDELHDGRADGPGLFGYRQVYVSPDRIAGALPALTGRPGPLPFAPPVASDPILALAVRTAFAGTPEPLALDALVLQLAEGLLRSSRAPLAGIRRGRVDPAALERGRDFLRSRLTVVQSSEVEAVTGLDRYQFARQFRAVYGTSPYRYSMMRRLDVARGLLGEPRPLAETALLVGFADQAHFTRAFRAAFGMTPGRYTQLRAARSGEETLAREGRAAQQGNRLNERMTDSELSLRPPTQDEFEQWLPRTEASYARAIAESGSMSAQEAADKARFDTERRFSNGLDSPGQVLFRLMAGDQPVGWLWLNVPTISGDPLMGWVNDIEVDSEYRGRGYGRAAMLLAEGEARARGMTSLGLNVHGQNTVARSLYDSLGYEVMTQQMRKPL